VVSGLDVVAIIEDKTNEQTIRAGLDADYISSTSSYILFSIESLFFTLFYGQQFLMKNVLYENP
jgi:hypothetical protein